MSIIFLGMELLGLCAIATAMFLLMRGDGSREQKLMQFFLTGTLIQNAGYLLELTAPTMEAAIVAVKVQYIGSLIIPICYCYFIFSYCFMDAPEAILHILETIDVLILGLVLTCDSHSLYYRRIEWLTDANGRGFLNLTYGPFYWIFMICSLAIPYTLSLYALIRVCIQKPEYTADRKYRLVLALSVLPVIALLSYALKLVHEYDPTPLVLGLVLSSVVILIWSRKVYDFSSLASTILLDSMADGVIALDDQKRIASYNPAAAEIFSDLKSRPIGRHIDGLNDFPNGMLEGQKGFFLNGHYYQGHTQPILDKSGKNKGYVVLILDVTETTNYIEEIKRVRVQAEEANIAKSAFLANMSHEIRTPMNAIVGLSDILMEESRGRKVYGYASDIKAAAKNLLALINDILDLSKVEAGRMELISTEYYLKTLVDEVLNMMDVVASQRGLILESEFDMSVPCRYLGDEGRIKQILINLISNAIKFTAKGYVRVSVSGVPEGDGNAERLTFRVEDSGCGIHKEDLPGIFDNFRQVDSKRNRSVEGTGLGLSITKHLVEMMDGSIQIESVYGKGSTFTVDILQRIKDHRPLLEVPDTAVPTDEALTPFCANDCSVLVVDDNRINLKVAQGFLQSYGLNITNACSGPEAIELVKKNRYDIIFMDHMMPGMDGIEAVQHIRSECGENGTQPTIIALTANAMEGVRETFLTNGFQDFLTKPIDRRTLHMILLKWIPEEKQKKGGGWMDSLQSSNNSLQKFQDVIIEGIDTDEVAEHSSASLEEFHELLNLYCLDGKRKLEVLRELWEEKDYKAYGIEVHALKSASANVGAMQVSNRAREQEKAVKREDFTFVDSHAEKLLAEYEEQLEHIRHYLDAIQKSENKKKKDKDILKADLLQEIRTALCSLENFKSKECAHKLEELSEYRLETDIEEKLERIREQLKLYEDDAAEQMLRELIEQMQKED